MVQHATLILSKEEAVTATSGAGLDFFFQFLLSPAIEAMRLHPFLLLVDPPHRRPPRPLWACSSHPTSLSCRTAVTGAAQTNCVPSSHNRRADCSAPDERGGGVRSAMKPTAGRNQSIADALVAARRRAAFNAALRSTPVRVVGLGVCVGLAALFTTSTQEESADKK